MKARARVKRGAAMGIRNPRRLARLISAGRLEAVLTLIAATPVSIRRRVARPVAAAIVPIAVRRPTVKLLPELAVVARWAGGPRTDAAVIVERLGTSPATPVRSRVRLARFASVCGLSPAALAIANSLPGVQAAPLAAIRARAAQSEGRYTDAIEHARRAPGSRAAAATMRLAESRLRVLQPDWEPDLGGEKARLVRLRGQTTPGRILHLVSSSLPYRQAGYTLRSQSVARSQQAEGLEPHFATRAGFPGVEAPTDAPREQVVDGIPYHRLSPDFRNTQYDDVLVTETARAAAELIERLRPAALHPASDFLQAQAALALGKVLAIPVVYEVRGFLEETWVSHPMHGNEADAMAADRYRLRRSAETRAMREATAVVTLSETMRADMIERGIDAAKIVVIPNAVDVERFQPIPRDDSLARELGIEPEETVVGYISSLSRYEGIRYLFEAAVSLREAGRKVRVLIVGDGPDRAALEALGVDLGLTGHTLLMPGRVPHDDVLRYYSIIDVFVVPRTANRVSRLVTPLKPYEAMAMERAVLVSDVPALREMVIPDETGLTFRAEDTRDLVAQLQRLLDDPALRLRLGRRAREWVTTSRTWAENGRRYRDLYERLGVV